MDDGAPTRYLGAYAVCVRDDAILLARIGPDDPVAAGRWTLPGGGVELGEAPDDAVIRELAEETGLRGHRRGVLGVFSRLYPSTADRPRPPAHVVGLLYAVDVEPGDLVPETVGSTDQCAWIPLAEATTLPLVELASYALTLL
jgi:8-oxo-dGTP diphosphatase